MRMTIESYVLSLALSWRGGFLWLRASEIVRRIWNVCSQWEPLC